MISKKKKIIILMGMVALLVITGVLNVYLNSSADDNITTTGGQVYSSFFQSYAADRKATREQTIMYLNAIIESSATSSDSLAAAEAEKLEIIKNMTIENTLEGQVKSLGYSDVVITSSSQKIMIIIKADDLDEIEVATILSLTLSETKRPATDVRIIPVS